MLGWISIHAPAKGATSVAVRATSASKSFQSTLPRRERQDEALALIASGVNFNPRSREGSDGGNTDTTATANISIHAPAKGATAAPVVYL